MYYGCIVFLLPNESGNPPIPISKKSPVKVNTLFNISNCHYIFIDAVVLYFPPPKFITKQFAIFALLNKLFAFNLLLKVRCPGWRMADGCLAVWV